MTVKAELLRLDGPAVRCSVTKTAMQGSFSGVIFTRAWVYDLGDGRRLSLAFGEESSEEDVALEVALADAAGWPL